MKFKSIALIALFVVIVPIIINIIRSSSCKQYDCLDFPEKSLWKIRDVYETSNTAWRALLIHPKYLVRIERYNTNDLQHANEHTKIRMIQLETLYETARSPYPGAVTDTISCQEKYKPKIKRLVSIHGIDVTYFTGFLNNRLNYGICIDDQIAYKGYTAMFYCPVSLNWYQIELIVSNKNTASDEEYTALFTDIGCHRPSVKIGRLFP